MHSTTKSWPCPVDAPQAALAVLPLSEQQQQGRSHRLRCSPAAAPAPLPPPPPPPPPPPVLRPPPPPPQLVGRPESRCQGERTLTGVVSHTPTVEYPHTTLIVTGPQHPSSAPICCMATLTHPGGRPYQPHSQPHLRLSRASQAPSQACRTDGDLLSSFARVSGAVDHPRAR